MTTSDERSRLAIICDLLDGQSLPSIGMQLVAGVQEQDDCAVYDLPGNLSLVIGSDFVRGTGFALFQEDLLSYFDIGYYLVVANLSDIAAMGATPTGLTTVIRYPDSLSDADFLLLMQGIKEAASHYRTPIVGGDIGGYSEMVLAATAFGVTGRGQYLKRQGAIVGDLLCTTGTLGLPSTALVYFLKAKKQGFRLSDEEEVVLLNSWRRPVAHVSTGITLAQSGLVHSCQDVSDGAKATIEQLAQASSLSFEIYEAQLPLSPITYKVAAALHINPLSLALSASVDFQLMFTLDQEDLSRLPALSPFAEIIPLGKAIPASEASRLIGSNGQSSPIPGTAWNQQSKSVVDVILNDGKVLEGIP